MQSAEIFNGLERACALRQGWKLPTDALRLVDGVGDGLEGVVVDRYNHHIQVQFYRPWPLASQRVLIQWVQEKFQPRFFVVKHRLDASGDSLHIPKLDVVHGLPEDSRTEVHEYGLRFAVDLLDTVNPGLFLDMRANRARIGALAAGKSVLNLFAYTCSFGVHCRVAGAQSVCNVDLSAKILARGRENLQLNNLEVQPGEFFRGDSREYLAYCARKGKRFGLIVLDPPSFSRGGQGNFSVRRDMGSLVAQCATLLDKGGFLFASSNWSGFSEESLGQTVVEAGAGQLRLEETWGADRDFTASGKTKESALVGALSQKV